MQGSGDELGLLSLESGGDGESDNGYGTLGVDRVCSGSRRRKGPAAEGDTSED